MWEHRIPLLCFASLGFSILSAGETGFSEAPTGLNLPALVTQHSLCGLGAAGAISCKKDPLVHTLPPQPSPDTSLKHCLSESGRIARSPLQSILGQEKQGRDGMPSPSGLAAEVFKIPDPEGARGCGLGTVPL